MNDRFWLGIQLIEGQFPTQELPFAKVRFGLQPFATMIGRAEYAHLRREVSRIPD